MKALALVGMALVLPACLFTESGTDGTADATGPDFDRRRAVGEVAGVERAQAAALSAARAQGEEQPAFDKLHLTTYANARELLGIDDRNLSLDEQDLVYAVTMSGAFEFRRAEDMTADGIYMILDAYTVDLMSVGTYPIAKGER